MFFFVGVLFWKTVRLNDSPKPSGYIWTANKKPECFPQKWQKTFFSKVFRKNFWGENSANWFQDVSLRQLGHEKKTLIFTLTFFPEHCTKKWIFFQNLQKIDHFVYHFFNPFFKTIVWGFGVKKKKKNWNEVFLFVFDLSEIGEWWNFWRKTLLHQTVHSHFFSL